MRYGKLWAIGLATVLGAGAAAAPPAHAGSSAVKCSLATLDGQYLEAANGMLFPPAFGVKEPSVSAAAAYSVYNGDGTGTDRVTFTVDGVNAKVPSPAKTTYTLMADCTGTKTVLPDGPHFDIFVAADGSGLTAVSTDQGFAVSEFDQRVGSAP
jgi:hypothetical protein